MNLQLLESPLPKPWLNIVCDSLTTNNLITPAGSSSCFCLFRTLGALFIPAGASSLVGANVSTIPLTPNVNLATNEYTCPSSGLLELSLNTRMSSNPNSLGGVTIAFTKNGAPLGFGYDTGFTAGAPNSGTLSLSVILSVNAGDVLGIRLDAGITFGVNIEIGRAHV